MMEKTKSALCDPSAITIHRKSGEDFVGVRLGKSLGIKKEKERKWSCDQVFVDTPW